MEIVDQAGSIEWLAVQALGPLGLLLFPLALLGLQARLAGQAERAGWLGWVASGMALLGTLAGPVVYIALLWDEYGSSVPPMSDLAIRSYGELVGSLLFGVGMILVGLSVRRIRLLPRWNGAPMLLGALVLGWAIVVGPGAPLYVRPGSRVSIWLGIERVLFPSWLWTSPPSGLANVRLFFLLLSACAWVALGYALWLARQPEAVPALPAGEVQT